MNASPGTASGKRPLIDKLSRRSGPGAPEWRAGAGVTIATLALMALLIGLGVWQLERLQWKRDLIAEREAGLAAPPAELPAASADWKDFAFRRVSASGEFRHDLEQYFGLSAMRGQPGHHVLTPLVRGDGSVVLVDRGWVPRDRLHPASRRDGQVQGTVSVTGIARYRADDAPGWMTPENDPAERLWYWYDLEALERAIGLDLLPVVVEADGQANPGGLPIGGRTRLELPNNHLQYAITWFGLAAVLAAIFVAYGVRWRGDAA